MRLRERRSAVLLDQHPLWLEAVAKVVGAEGLDIAAKTTDRDDALALVEEHRPDLLVTEIDFGNGPEDGIAFLRRALDLAAELKTIVLSQRTDAESIRPALAAGAAAYVVKTAQPADLASAVRQVFNHSVYVANAIPMELGSPQPLDIESDELTPREVEILVLVAEGFSNAEVAKKLWVTEQTVKVHLSKIYRKLGVSNRTEASRWALLKALHGTGGLQPAL